MARMIARPAPSCASCRFFALNPHPATYGACRIRAPRPAAEDGARGVWPGVLGTDGCGEYALDHERLVLARGEGRA